MDTEYSRGWLRAFFDGEGNVSWTNRHIAFANTEPSVIGDCIRHLSVFGITPRRYEQTRGAHKPITRLVVSRRQDVRRFVEEVGSSIPYKRETMDRLLAHYDRPNQKRRNRWGGPPVPAREELKAMLDRGMKHRAISEALGIPIGSLGKYKRDYGLHEPHRTGDQPDPEEVRRAYWGEGLTLEQLGERFGYKGKGISVFMKRHGIPRRAAHRWNKQPAHQDTV
jgi:hypothetical protein